MPEASIVLTCAPGVAALDPSFISSLAVELCPGSGLTWLAENDACWIELRDETYAQVAVQAIKSTLAGRPVDVNLVPSGRAQAAKTLLVADMESTVIQQECLDELAEYAGAREQVEAITVKAMRGELEFDAALRERVALLAGLDARLLQDVYDERVSLMPGAQTLVATMRGAGAYCALVSGGFTFYTEKVAQRLGFDTHQGNDLHVREGKIAGTVGDPILGRQAKRESLVRLAEQNGVALNQTLAVGDGANDLEMLASAGLGVAYHAKPAVAEAAKVSLRYADLTGLLYLQGYAKADFKTD